jgi:hypothetical protein
VKALGDTHTQRGQYRVNDQGVGILQENDVRLALLFPCINQSLAQQQMMNWCSNKQNKQTHNE